MPTGPADQARNIIARAETQPTHGRRSPAWERGAKARRRITGRAEPAVPRGQAGAVPGRVGRDSASVVNPENLAHRCDHKEIPRTAPSLPFVVESFRFKAGTTIAQARPSRGRSACRRRSETRAAGAELPVQSNYNTSIARGRTAKSRRLVPETTGKTRTRPIARHHLGAASVNPNVCAQDPIGAWNVAGGGWSVAGGGTNGEILHLWRFSQARGYSIGAMMASSENCGSENQPHAHTAIFMGWGATRRHDSSFAVF